MIVRLSNQSNLKERRVKLRKDQTIHEGKLWSHIRNSKLGCKFRRQHSIDSYILDFYCTEKKLAIEVDGLQHDQSEYDRKRDEYFISLGITTLRFWNNEVDQSMEGVILKIQEFLDSK
jgi:very-short-patch-repair endonuclease